MAGIENFMNAISALESGHNYNATGPYTGSTYGRAKGRYQIMEKIYPAWAREAGVDPNDYSPGAQDRVARYKMQQYYNQFGSWDLVAVAWFAGPGRAAKAKQQGINSVGRIKDVLGTSVSKYVQKVQANMGSGSDRPPSQPAPAAQRSGSIGPGKVPEWADREASQRAVQAPGWLARGMQERGMGRFGDESSMGEPGAARDEMLAQAPQMTPGEIQTANDQIGQEVFGAILSNISAAASSRGDGQILDLKNFLGLPPAEVPEEAAAPAMPVNAESPAPTDAPPTDSGQLAPPPKHKSFEGLVDSAKVATQQLMGNFPGLRFTSGYRDAARNTAAGGVKNSKHLTGQASDFVGSEEEMKQAAAWAKAQGAKVLIHDSGSGRHLHVEWP